MPDNLQGYQCLNMRTLVHTEQIIAPQKALLLKNSSHNKNGFSSCLLKHLLRCVLLFFGLFLCVSFAFVLCTVEGSMRLAGKRSVQERRLLGYHGNTPAQDFQPRSFATSPSHLHTEDMFTNGTLPHLYAEAALHGLGSVYMKGTKLMQNLIIANLEESSNMLDFRVFLRTLFRSPTISRADLVLLFPWSSLPAGVSEVLKEECGSFNKFHTMNFDRPPHSSRGDSFEEYKEMLKRGDINLARRRGQIYWGANPNAQEGQEQTNSYNPDYGSVVGFHMNELDSTDAFLQFLNNPSSQLRRWLCYQMLLGLLRYKFRLVMLVELGGAVIFGDVFASTKLKDFLYLTQEDYAWDDATADSNYVSLRQSSWGSLQGGVERVTENRNMLNDLKPKTSSKRKKKHDEHQRYSRVRERNRNLLAGGHAGVLQLHDGSKDAGAGEETTAVESVHDFMRYFKPKQGLMEMVYGREVWNSLEQVEKQRRVISSRVILGSMRSAKGLASIMVVEIVRVALQRNSKISFPDSALLSYLVQKSPHLLGRRVTENLRVMENSDSMIRSVESLKLEDALLRSQDGQNYTVLHASSLNTRRTSAPSFQNQQIESMQSNMTLAGLILANICASTTNASVFYPDCGQGHTET